MTRSSYNHSNNESDTGFSDAEEYDLTGPKTPIADVHVDVLSYVQTIEKALMRNYHFRIFIFSSVSRMRSVASSNALACARVIRCSSNFLSIAS